MAYPPRVPDAVQHERSEVVHRRSGTAKDTGLDTIPGLQRTVSLRFTLRRARDT
jgi:hypothetical protein